MSVVLDASAALALVLPDESGNEDRWSDLLTSQAIDVPGLWHYEVANALIVGVRRQRLASAEAGLAASLLSSIGVRTHPAPPLARTLAIGAMYDLSAYDAAYLVLAIDTGGTLLTQDVGSREGCYSGGCATRVMARPLDESSKSSPAYTRRRSNSSTRRV